MRFSSYFYCLHRHPIRGMKSSLPLVLFSVVWVTMMQFFPSEIKTGLQVSVCLYWPFSSIIEALWKLVGKQIDLLPGVLLTLLVYIVYGSFLNPYLCLCWVAPQPINLGVWKPQAFLLAHWINTPSDWEGNLSLDGFYHDQVRIKPKM